MKGLREETREEEREREKFKRVKEVIRDRRNDSSVLTKTQRT